MATRNAQTGSPNRNTRISISPPYACSGSSRNGASASTTTVRTRRRCLTRTRTPRPASSQTTADCTNRAVTTSLWSALPAATRLPRLAPAPPEPSPPTMSVTWPDTNGQAGTTIQRPTSAAVPTQSCQCGVRPTSQSAKKARISMNGVSW